MYPLWSRLCALDKLNNGAEREPPSKGVGETQSRGLGTKRSGIITLTTGNEDRAREDSQGGPSVV